METLLLGGNTSGLIYRFTHENGKPLFNHWGGDTYDITDNEDYGAKVETFNNYENGKIQICDLPIKDKTPNKIIIDLKFNKDSTYISRPQLFIGNITSDFVISLFRSSVLTPKWDYNDWVEYMCPNSIFNMGVISETGNIYFNNVPPDALICGMYSKRFNSNSDVLNRWLRLVFNNIDITTRKLDLLIYDLSLNKSLADWIELEFENNVDINCIACGLNNNELSFGNIEVYY